jgi:mono/diheme cytochrome c family protein
MSITCKARFIRFLVVLAIAGLAAWFVLRSSADPAPKGPANRPGPAAETGDQQFAARVRPFLERYCFSCHGTGKPEAGLDLRRAASATGIADRARPWDLILERLQADEMPPADAARRPGRDERAAVVAWLREQHDRRARQHVGDPGTVLARRLSNAELDDTVRDLTGVDMRPTREFPVDPANEAGFDNSGESLAMSPALLKKYLAAARQVTDHVVLKPEGFVFAPHPAVTDTDRDAYCVARILDFYERHSVDLADYLLAAWKYHNRDRLGRSDADLARFAAEAGLSASYLALIWSALTESGEETGPLAVVREHWHALPEPAAARAGCERLRDLALRMRRQLHPKVTRLHVKGISDGSQPLVLWNDRQLASQHRSYSGDVLADCRKLAGQFGTHPATAASVAALLVSRTGQGPLLAASALIPARIKLPGPDADLERRFAIPATDAATEERLRRALQRFCALFPDAFLVSDRGAYFDATSAGKGRPLTAGFHLMQGYFRDDGPLYDLILDERARRELDALWNELDFITGVPMRQYKDFIFFERAEPPRFMFDAEFDFARSEDKDATSEAKMARLAKAHLARARKLGANDEALQAIETYYADMSAAIRRVERGRLAAEPSHLAALLAFAERAYRRPLSAAERDDLLAFYHRLRRDEELGHEDALRDTLVTVLLSPHFCYRFDLAELGTAVRPLSDYALASRLSYFLWSSMPDAELLGHAAAGDLHEPRVLTVQARRMLRDPRVRGLAAEFAGNWLDFRRFEEHNGVDRGRFPTFTNELRQAMFEEPVRYFLNVVQRDRPVLDLLYGNDTFVNPVLARHYGMPEPKKGSGVVSAAGNDSRPLFQDGWAHVADARPYGRGGLLPMAVFLTKNAPGLRTSPVKRGYWVVRRLLGERIPPPPPTVPELPKDEAKLGELTLPQLLARHRADKSCAGCHSRFDAIGLAFEGYGPIGERRAKDLGGRPVQTVATFPDGTDRQGLDGLRAYLHDRRQDEFLENLCRKLLAYALGRNLLPSDRPTLDQMRARLTAGEDRFGSLVDAVVTSPPFLNKRGRDDLREP